MPRTPLRPRRPSATLALALGLALAGWLLMPPGLGSFVAPTARAAAVFTVNSTADTDDGACTTAPQGCTLREAINAANAAAGADTIAFNIEGAGVRTISPASPLPTITDPVVIDGYTQPGASPNTLANGNDAVLLVELNGSVLGAPGGQLHRGLVITAGASTVRGLVINRFAGAAVELGSKGNNVVEGNFIGLTADGASRAGNGDGVTVVVGSSDNLIGGATPAARNVISGSGGNGIRIISTQVAPLRNIVRGNFIGTDASGTRAVGNNSSAIFVDTGTNIIGGTAPGDRNVISGSPTNAGVFLGNGQSGAGNTVQGNFIGTDVTGTRPLGNFFGVWINFASNNVVGGAAATSGNLISGNQTGVFITGDFSRNNQLGGNLIGTDATGTRPLGNARNGVEISGSSNGNAVQQMGPDALPNTIAFNGGSGVAVISPPSRNNAIRHNNIFSNGGLGIDLDGDGVTPNDGLDADQGGNDYQNFPVISSAVSNGATTTIQGTLNSKPNTVYGLDFFTNSACDPSGHGEGARFFAGSGTTTDANGNATFSLTFPSALPAGRVVTATATDNTAGSRNTSEFSPCNAAGAAGSVQFSAASYEVGEDGGNATITLVRVGGSSGTLTVNFATSSGTAAAGDDYTAVSEAITFAEGETNKTVTVPVFLDGATEPDETVGLLLFNATDPDAVGARGVSVLNIVDSSKTVAFNAAGFAASEGTHVVTVTVTRNGDTSAGASVGYATTDGTATERKDYTTAVGRLRFAPGEASKSLDLIITDDRFDDDNETFTVTLNNPSGLTLGPQNSSTVTINDNDAANGVSPVRDAAFDTEFFVRQHYADFLNRIPDAGGLQFWSDGINSCGADAQCREVKKIDTSAAFFLSIEFQETGFLAYRTRKAAFGDLPGKPVPVTLRGFLFDSRQISENLVVGTPGWPQQLEANKQAYFNEFVTRPAFLEKYPETMNPGEYVDALFATAGVLPTQAERSSAISAFVFGGAAGRARALRSVAESQTLKQAETNRAFVLMQYFGYLRRNPDDTDFQNNPDPQFLGYTFWLNKLNQFNGNYVDAEMVKAFIQSIEYGDRFGQ